MSKILQDSQSDLLNKFFPYINKEYLTDRLIFFYEKIFRNQPNINMQGTIDEKINQLFNYFKFDIRNYYDNKEFIAINYLRILSDDNIEDATLRYIIFYCTCFNAKQPDYKVFQVNNNFYITVTAEKKKTVKYSNINDIKNDSLNIKKNELKLPSHFQYYIERRDHYSNLIMNPFLSNTVVKEKARYRFYRNACSKKTSTSTEVAGCADKDIVPDPLMLKLVKDMISIPNIPDNELEKYVSNLHVGDSTRLTFNYIKTKPLIAKLDMSFMFKPIQNNTFENLMNNLKKSSDENNNVITLLFCEYIVTQYIKNNYKTHINYTYTTVPSTTGLSTTSGEDQLTNLPEIGNKIRSWVSKIILPRYYTTSIPTLQAQAIINPPNKDTIIDDNLIDIYLRSNINNISKNIIDILKEKYNDAFILDLYVVLYHRSSGLHLTKQYTYQNININSTSGIINEPLSSFDYIFTGNNIITDTDKKWNSNLYNLNNSIEGSITTDKIFKTNQDYINRVIGNGQIKSFDPYYHHMDTSARGYNQREIYYINIINQIKKYIDTLYDISTIYGISKTYNRNALLTSCYELMNVLLINLIRILQINDIKNNDDIYSKISVFNTYFKLGFDEFYILNKAFDKANKNYDNRMSMYYIFYPLTDAKGNITHDIASVQMFQTISLMQVFNDYNYTPFYVEIPNRLDINSDYYLKYITDAAIRSSCQQQWDSLGAQPVLSCVTPADLGGYNKDKEYKFDDNGNYVFDNNDGKYMFDNRIFKTKFERETSIIS